MKGDFCLRDVPIWQLGYSAHLEDSGDYGTGHCGGYRCSVCNGYCDCADAVLYSNGDRVCSQCREGYLQERSGGFTEEYIGENQEDFFAFIEERLI